MQGGALLFSDGRGTPLLTLEEFEDDRNVWRRPLSSILERRDEVRGSGRQQWRGTIHRASSAEGIRALKASLGVPSRPVTAREPGGAR